MTLTQAIAESGYALSQRERQIAESFYQYGKMDEVESRELVDEAYYQRQIDNQKHIDKTNDTPE